MSKVRRLSTTITVALVAALGFVFQAHAAGFETSGPAISTELGCGAVITIDTRLTSNLMNCPNSGIVIGADNITLDLNGHTVGGNGAPVASCLPGAFCGLGIDNTAGHSGVTIKNGAVQRFDVDIFALGGSGNQIQNISSANSSSFGIIVGNSTGSRIDHVSSLADGTSGIVMFDSHDNRIDHNSVTGAHGYAIPVFGSSQIRLDENVMDGNDHGILLGDSSDNEVHGNRISHSGGSSIDMGPASSSGNRVEENVLTDNGDGVVLTEAQHNRISDNQISGTGFFGFPYAGGFGIILDGADDNIVQRNTVTDGRGPAILVTSLDSPNSSDRNAVSNNVATSKFSDGIIVNNNAAGTLLELNTASGSGHDGIEVDAVGTTVTRNTANDNYNLGVEAAPGVIDGGGNRASGNGNPLQCTNVICS